jgi:hypothetical protein
MFAFLNNSLKHLALSFTALMSLGVTTSFAMIASDTEHGEVRTRRDGTNLGSSMARIWVKGSGASGFEISGLSSTLVHVDLEKGVGTLLTAWHGVLVDYVKGVSKVSVNFLKENDNYGDIEALDFQRYPNYSGRQSIAGYEATSRLVKLDDAGMADLVRDDGDFCLIRFRLPPGFSVAPAALQIATESHKMLRTFPSFFGGYGNFAVNGSAQWDLDRSHVARVAIIDVTLYSSDDSLQTTGSYYNISLLSSESDPASLLRRNPFKYINNSANKSMAESGFSFAFPTPGDSGGPLLAYNGSTNQFEVTGVLSRIVPPFDLEKPAVIAVWGAITSQVKDWVTSSVSSDSGWIPF